MAQQTFNIAVSPEGDVQFGRYAHAVRATVTEHDTQIDFVAIDSGTLDSEGATGSGLLVARVYIANTNLRSVVDVLVSQVEAFEAAKAKTAKKKS